MATTRTFSQQSTSIFDGLSVESDGQTTPTFTDLDGDGLQDAIVGVGDGTIKYFKNTGTSTSAILTEQTGASNPFDGIDIGDVSHPELADIDGDGDFDLFVGDSNGNIFFYENTGNSTTPTFSTTPTSATDSGTVFNISAVGQYATPTFVDIDGDGDLDAFIGQYDTIVYYENQGTSTSANFVEQTGASNPLNGVSTSFPSPPDKRLDQAFIDSDLDGDLDVFIGQGDGQILYYENQGTSATPNFVQQTGTNNPFNTYNSSSSVSSNFREVPTPTFVDIDGDGDHEAFIGSRLAKSDNGEAGIIFFESSTTTTVDPDPDPDPSTSNFLRFENDTFIVGSQGGNNLKFTLTGDSASSITELNLNFLSGGGMDSEIFSILPSNLRPTGFDLSFQGSIFENVSADQTFIIELKTLGGSSAATPVSVTEISTGQFSINFSNGITLNIEQTGDSVPIGVGSEQKQGQELLDLQTSGGSLRGAFTVYREARFDNVVGFYKIDDISGTVGGFSPGDSGYAKAAIENRVTDLSLSVSNNSIASINGIFDGGALYAPFIISNGTIDDFLNFNSDNAGTGRAVSYFAYTSANPDGADHVRLLGNNTFGFEDLPGGGDLDYNDIIFQVNFS